MYTYKSQSIARIKEISPDGRPTVSSTITIVTKPACGIPAAPILAAVAVILQNISWYIISKNSFITHTLLHTILII
jgi:hypothetical protein